MKKYRKIILLIVSIIIFNVVVALSSYVISRSIDTYSAYGTSLAEQQVSLDKMSKDIIDINTFAERLKGDKDPKSLDKFIEDTYSQVEDTRQFYHYLVLAINAFATGQQLQINNKTYQIPQPTDEAIVISQRINEIWRPLSALINKMTNEFLDGKLDDLDSNIRFSADYIRKYSEILGGYLGELQDYYQGKANHYTFWLNTLQLFAVAFTLIFFGFLTYFGLRSLIVTDAELEKARRENADIMRTVKEGLFLVEQDLSISNQYSTNLEKILNNRNIAERKLNELLRDIISKQDFETTKEFIAQLFNEEVVEDLITELNPLDEVKVFFQSDDDVKQHYLSFNFSRVYNKNDEIVRVLVSVSDITNQKMLEEKLQKEQSKHDEHIEMLSSIINIPAVTLQSFIRHVNSSCNIMNNILKSSDEDSQATREQLLEKANQIFRYVHSIKGEASALGLHSFVSLAEEMESKIAKLKTNSNLTGQDFLSLVMDLDNLLKLNDRIINIKRNAIGEAASETEQARILPDRSKAQIEQFKKIVADVAKRNHKEAEFAVRGWFAVQQLSEWQQDKLQEIIIQLLRNAVVHGIETPAKRKELHKNNPPKVYCEIMDNNNNELRIIIADNGAGINFQNLYQKAVDEKLINPNTMPYDNSDKMKEQLIHYLFRSGVSTAKVQNEDAGRGVGMDVVKAAVEELSGTIKTSTKQGVNTCFTIKIPIDIEKFKNPV